MLLSHWHHWLFSPRPRSRRSSLRWRSHRRLDSAIALVEVLEDRTLLASAIVPLDPTLDQLGFQPAVVQAFDDPNTPEQEHWVAFGIFDTGASVVTLSATDGFFFEPPFPIKVSGGAEAEGIGGILTGDVSQPVTTIVDGLGAATLEFEEILPGVFFPNFSFDLSGAVDIVPGVQVFIGTLGDTGSAGSENLPTIAGTPMLNPTPANPDGLAALFEPEGELLDLTSFAPGFVLPVPNVEFRQPGSTLTASAQVSDSGTVNDPEATSTMFTADADLLDIDEIYVGFTLRFVDGALSGEGRVITDYDGATRTFTLESGLSAAPEDGDAFEIVRFSSEPIEIDLELIGQEFANHTDPGDDVTIAPLPVHNGISLSHNGAAISDQNFLFDTGAMLSTITTEMRDQLGLDPNNPDGTIDVGGAAGTVASIPGYVLDEFAVPTSEGGTLTFTDVWVFVLDVSTEIGGIWGMNMFNPAAQFQYDPFDPDGTPSLQITFFEDRIHQPLPTLEEGELDALLSLPFAGALGFGTPGLPGFQVEATAMDTTTVLTSDANPSIVDQTVTFTAMVSAASSSEIPTGTVEFRVDGNLENTVDLDAAGVATFQTSALAVGTRTIEATYVPDSEDFLGSSDTVVQTVDPDSTILGLSSDANPSEFGQTVTFTAMVSAASSSEIPIGTVEFRVDGNLENTVDLDAAGVAIFQTSALAVGTRTIEATYVPDSEDFLGSSETLSQEVNPDDDDDDGDEIENRIIVTASSGESGSAVQVTDADTNELLFDLDPYPGFLGGVRVAVGDVTGDGTPDIITGPGPGGGPHIKVIDGSDGSTERLSFFAFDRTFRGGVFVAAADLNGDDRADIIVGADAGGGPHIRVFSGEDASELFSFFVYNTDFRGGVRVAAGDITGDGTPDIITAAGPGGGPHVRVFDGTTLQTDGGLGINIGGALGNFFAYSRDFRGGVFVAAGDVDGNSKMDIITGPGAGGGPHVRVFSGATGSQLTGPVGSFFAYGAGFTGGVRVAAVDINADGQADVTTTPGPGGGPHLRIFNSDSEGTALEEVRSDFVADSSFRGGVFVAGGTASPGDSTTLSLRLAESFAPSGDGPTVTSSEVTPLFQAALARLEAGNVPSESLEALAALTLEVADLEGNMLAQAQPGSLVLDINAAGMGWYVDPTPDTDEEFAAGSFHAIDPNAMGRVDLSTVILHELGHHLGGDDLDAERHPGHFLAESLAAGERRLPTVEDLDLLFAESDLLGSVLS